MNAMRRQPAIGDDVSWKCGRLGHSGRGQDARAPRLRPRRRGYTLIELVISAGAASVLVVGLASALVLSSQAFDGTGAAAAHANAAAVQADLMADLNDATGFTTRTATAATFTVPDRDGDGEEETLSYTWTGLPAAQLHYSYNDGSVATLLTDVQAFGLTYLGRTVAAAPYTPPVSDPNQWGMRWLTVLEFGYHSVFSKTTGSDGSQSATRVALSQDGTLTQITAFIDPGTQAYSYAIYNDFFGFPTSLAAQAAWGQGTGGGANWYSLSVVPTKLPAGNYWLAIAFESKKQKLYYIDNQGGSGRINGWDAFRNGWASNWGSSSAYSAKMSIYATYTKP